MPLFKGILIDIYAIFNFYRTAMIYNTITKQPKMTIEVDGWQYHKGNEAQESRDVLEDEILIRYGLKPWRISTMDVIDVEVIKNKLKDISK